MRVAMVAPPWLPIPPKGYGGIENVIHVLVPELIKLGVKVELFSLAETDLKATKNHYLYKTGQYEHIHKPGYYSFPAFAAHTLWVMQSVLSDGHFDVIHDHNEYVGPAMYAHTHGFPPFVHTLHGPPFTSKDRIEAGIPDTTQFWNQFAQVKNLFIVPISKALARGAPAKLRPRLTRHVHNAVNPDDFPFFAQKSDYFITLARFHPDKGQHLAVQACKELKAPLKMAGSVAGIAKPKQLMMELANPSSKLRSVTDFRFFSDQIFPHLGGNIEHVGDLAGQEKLEAVGKARALLFPIQWEEPFGMAPIEALACGTPVVAMARGALPEIIEHGVNGFLAKDMDEFKKYMQQVDRINPKACRESVEQKFSGRSMAKKYLQRYQEAIAATKR